MHYSLSISLVLSLFPLIFLGVSLLTHPKKEVLKTKKSSFECGYNFMAPLSSSSPRFFTIAIIFLIFDLEIALLMPLLSLNLLSLSLWKDTLFFLILFLSLTTVMEWNSLSLAWVL